MVDDTGFFRSGELKTAFANIDHCKKTLESIELLLGYKKRAAKEVEDKIPERIKDNLRDVNSELKAIFKDLIEEVGSQ